MIQDLIYVVDKETDFAEAHNMLAMARLAGRRRPFRDRVDKDRDPTQSTQRAVSSQPGADRSRGKEVGRCTALLERLKDSSIPQIAQTARKSLADLPTLKKYGVLPQTCRRRRHNGGRTRAGPNERPRLRKDDAFRPGRSSLRPSPRSDRRKVQFVRGKLTKVDCSRVRWRF